MVLADLNGDGWVDIVTASWTPNSVSVLLGNGDGTFASQATFAVGSSPNSVALADLNGDGQVDIVTANRNSSNVSVLLGNGDGTFAAQATFTVGSQPWSVALADLNGDGQVDIVTTNKGSNNMSVLLNQGSTDLAITKTSGPNPVIAGNDLTYTITVTNNGPSHATNVLITDCLPSEVRYVSHSTTDGTASHDGSPVDGTVTWNVGSLTSGSSATLTITVVVKSSSTGIIINTATVSGAETDPIIGNNMATQETRISSPGAVPAISFWGSVALAVLFCVVLVWLIRRRLILEGRTL